MKLNSIATLPFVAAVGKGNRQAIIHMKYQTFSTLWKAIYNLDISTKNVDASNSQLDNTLSHYLFYYLMHEKCTREFIQLHFIPNECVSYFVSLIIKCNVHMPFLIFMRLLFIFVRDRCAVFLLARDFSFHYKFRIPCDARVWLSSLCVAHKHKIMKNTNGNELQHTIIFFSSNRRFVALSLW